MLSISYFGIRFRSFFLCSAKLIAKRMDVTKKDCIDQTCDVEYRFMENCLIYDDLDAAHPCDYPCSTTNCQTEFHSWIDCPVWTCEPKSTTTQMPSTSTPGPEPGPSGSHCSGLCISSIAVNALLVLVVAALLVFVRRIMRQNSTNDEGLSNPLFDHAYDYFVNQRSGPERLPLLPLVDPQRQGQFETVDLRSNDSEHRTASPLAASPSYLMASAPALLSNEAETRF